MSVISINGKRLLINDIVSHLRDSFMMDIYPEEQLDCFLALDTNNNQIYFIWKHIFTNSTHEQNIGWFVQKKLKTIFFESVNIFKDESIQTNLKDIISNNINDHYTVI